MRIVSIIKTMLKRGANKFRIEQNRLNKSAYHIGAIKHDNKNTHTFLYRGGNVVE